MSTVNATKFGGLMTTNAVSDLVELLQYWAAQRPNACAYTFLNDDEHETTLSYGELDADARRIAGYLQDHAEQGDRALLVVSAGARIHSGVFRLLVCWRAAGADVLSQGQSPDAATDEHRGRHPPGRAARKCRDAQPKCRRPKVRGPTCIARRSTRSATIGLPVGSVRRSRPTTSPSCNTRPARPANRRA